MISYQYDSDGIRVSSTVNGVKTEYLVDKNLPYSQVLEERVNNGLVADYVYGLDLISQQRGTEQSFYLVDGLGSTRTLTNANGNVTDTYAYDAFGNLISSTNNVQNNYLFAGEQFDRNLGDYYLRQRYYDTDTGRFTRRDSYEGSLSEPISLHKYVYGNANPVNFVDPLGLYSQQFGYGVEDVVRPIYIQEHPGDNISFGQLVSGKKPDILNQTRRLFNDIKPLSPSGILDGTFALGEYSLTYTNYSPDIFWKAPPNVIITTVTRGEPGEVPKNVIIFNAGGILFYTDQLNNLNQILALGAIRPEDFRSRLRPLLVASSYSSVNPLAKSRYLFDFTNKSLYTLEFVLLASLIAVAASTKAYA